MCPIQHLNPEGLAHNPAFSQAVSVSGPHRTIYVGGQDAVDAAGNVVGVGDLAAQTRQIFANLKLALAAGGAGLEHIVKWNVYVVQGQDLRPGFEVAMEELGQQGNPPAISGMFVSSLAHPDFLVEIDAVAVVPE
jgi:enamine deaminase RidA (YjgF/YER057c/UK114 family)